MIDLFKLLELTRAQPQYGYNVSLKGRGALPDLAQHHYLVAMIAWQLARRANAAGANVDVLRTLEMALVHDLPELFGGDINFYYARANSEARKGAKIMQEANAEFLAKHFEQDGGHFRELVEEEGKRETNEAVIVRVADHLECLVYKNYVSISSKHDKEGAFALLYKNAKRAPDQKVQDSLSEIIKAIETGFAEDRSLEDIIWRSGDTLED